MSKLVLLYLKIVSILLPCDANDDDQLSFLRFLIKTGWVNFFFGSFFVQR